MFRKWLILFCFMWVAFSSISFAQDERPARIVSLEEVSRLAIENNFDIQLTKYDILISRFNIDAARSIYDTMLTAEARYLDDQFDRSSALFPERSTTRGVNAGLSKLLPTGTEISINQSFERAWTREGFATVNPAYDSVTTLTVDQDLGRNFFGRQTRGLIRITMEDVRNNNLLSFFKIESLLADVQRGYWNLVYLNDVLKIRQEMVEQAKRLFDIDRGRIKHGLVEAPQLFGSEANYQTRRAELMLAESALKTGVNLLKLSLNIDHDAVNLIPEEGFQMPEHQVSLIESMKKAFENRRDYKQAINEIRRRDLMLEYARNNEWPEINLTGSFARNGLGTDFNDSINRVIEENNPQFFASLSFSFPLENRGARAERKQAELQKASSLLNAKYQERKIAIEIKDQITASDAAYERLQYLTRAAELQQKKALEQERIFHQGRSDSDTVIRFQEDALFARIALVQAFYDYYASMIELKRREGTLLKVYWDGEI